MKAPWCQFFILLMELFQLCRRKEDKKGVHINVVSPTLNSTITHRKVPSLLAPSSLLYLNLSSITMVTTLHGAKNMLLPSTWVRNWWVLRCCTHIQTYIQTYCIHYADAYRDNIIIDYLIQSIQLKQHFHMHAKRILSICNTHRCTKCTHNTLHTPYWYMLHSLFQWMYMYHCNQWHMCVWYWYHSNVIQLFSSNIYGHLYMYRGHQAVVDMGGLMTYKKTKQ